MGYDTNVTDEVPSKESKYFVGWSLNSSAENVVYESGATFSIDADTTLYAVWEEQTDGDMQSFNCASLASGATAKRLRC